MLRSRSFDLTNRIIETENTKVSVLRGSVGADLQDLAKDRAIVTDPEETRRRRTIRLSRQHLKASWGFTLQTYGIRNKRSREVEVMSYVDYVEMNGPAYRAGMKKGDVILSVNGESVDLFTHRDLVTKIQRGGRELRLVVLFEDCCKKVELQERYIRLKKLLNLKLKELRRLEGEESRLLRGGAQQTASYGETNGENFCSTPTLLSRLSALRQSAMSQSSLYSSASSDWDVYSEITSPTSLDDVRVNKFTYDGSLSDVSYVSSAKGSNGSVSISSSSDSQSEHKIDLAGDARRGSSTNDISGKGILRGVRFSSNGQGEESELDISISTGLDDGDTDSQTSFSLSESSPKMRSLSDVMAREELSRLHDASPSVEEENFRQMYTVARWVGMNSEAVRRRSLSLGGPGDILSGPIRTRNLGSVSESGEELVTNGKEKPGLNLVKEGEECGGNNSGDASVAQTTKGSRQQLTPTADNFYIESDSEESSIVSGGRGRRDTVIEVRDYDMYYAQNTSNSSGHSGPSTGGDSRNNTPVKEAKTNGTPSSTNKDPRTTATSLDTPSDDTSNVNSECVMEPVHEESNGRTSDSPVASSIQSDIEADEDNTSGSSRCDPSSDGPKFIDGVLINDQTYTTKL